MNKTDKPVIMLVRFSDIEFHTVMDPSFKGFFYTTSGVHSHEYFELQAAIKGEYVIEFFEGKPIVMNKNSLCLIPPKCYHSTHSETQIEKFTMRFKYNQICSDIDEKTIYESFNSILTNITAPVHINLDDSCSLFKSIREELLSDENYSELMARLYIGQIYLKLLRLLDVYECEKRELNKQENDSNDSRYYAMELYFSKHYSEQITEASLAAQLGLSKRQTSRVFKTAYKMSFREKLIDVRMAKAAKMLAKTDIPIAEIAYMIGYTSISGFYVAFKRRFGISALEYRKKLSEENI